MHVGTLFHEFARDFFDFLDYETLMTLNSLDDVREHFKTFVVDQPPVVKRLCYNFIELEAQRFWKLREQTSDPLRYFKPVATELHVADKNLGLEGTVDRIDRMLDENLAIVEYKTGSPNIRSVRLELGFYVILLQSRYPNIRYIVIYNPTHQKFHLDEVSPRLLSTVRRRIAQFRRAQELGEYPPRPGLHCAWCIMKKYCKEVRE